MKKTTYITAILAAALFSGAAFAEPGEAYFAGPTVQNGLETDMIYGNQELNPSIGEAYVAGPTVQNGLETDLIYGS